MADEAKVTLIIEGREVGVREAAAQAEQALHALGLSAGQTGTDLGVKFGGAAKRAGEEAAGLGTRARLAGEMVATLGAESAETVLKIQGLSRGLGEAREAFGGLGGALTSVLGGMIAFSALDFAKESVESAMEAEQTTAAFNAELSKTPGLVAAANASLEEANGQLTHLGISQDAARAAMARAAQGGLDPRTITEQTDAWADLAQVEGTTVLGAVTLLTSGQRGLSTALRALNVPAIQQREIMKQLAGASASERAAFVLSMVEHSKAAGVAEAKAGTAAGAFTQFHTAVGNLREEVGNALLPALTQLAVAMTTLLVGLEHLAAPFGGLANVLKVLFIPMLILGLKLFLGLKGTFTALVDTMLGRVAPAMTQTAMAMGEADAEARNLAADISSIPTDATTTALFIPATAIKDAYKANIFSIPPEWVTKGIFEPAPIEQAVTDELVAAEKIVDATPVAVPLELLAPAETEVQTAIADLRATLAAAGAPEIKIVPVAAMSAADQAALLAKLRADVALLGPVSVPISLGLPGEAQISAADSALESALSGKVVGHASMIIDAVDHVTTQLGAIRSKAQAFMTAHPLHWVVQGAGTGAAMGAGFAIAGQLFQNAKFDKATFTGDIKLAQSKLGLSTAPSWTAKDEANLAAMRKRLDQPLDVKIAGGGKVDVGPLGSALVGLKLSRDDRALLQQQISKLEAIKQAAEKYNQTFKNPIPVKLVFDWGEVLRMIGEVAVGTIIANLATRFLDPGRLLGLLKGLGGKLGNLLRGPEEPPGGTGGGGKVLPFPGGGSPEGSLINDLLRALSVAPIAAAAPTGAPGSIPVITGLGNLAGAIGDAIKHIDWHKVLVAAGFAVAITAAIASALLLAAGAALAAFGVLLKAVFSPTSAQAAGMDDATKKAVGKARQQAMGSLLDLGGDVIDAFIEGIKHHWPSAFPWVFGGERPKHGALYIDEKNYPEYVKAGSKVPSAPRGYEYVSTGQAAFPYRLEQLIKGQPQAVPSDFIGRYGGGALSATVLRQLGGVTAGLGLVPAGTARGAPAPPPRPSALTAHITINDARDPHMVAQQVTRALEDFVSGAKGTRRLAG